MDLVVFDLDGTLLNKQSVISTYTRDTLRLLGERNVAYTVATGRSLHASRDILEGHRFELPHVYKNGVMIWHPSTAEFTHKNVLTHNELRHVLSAFDDAKLAPFVFTLSGDDEHAVYHAALHSDAEKKLVDLYMTGRGLAIYPLEMLPPGAQITNVSAIGPGPAVERVTSLVADEPHLVAYCGEAIEGNELYWLDIHHSAASKGGAVDALRDMLAVERVICFGDSDNDLSLFKLADESYAPQNAKPHVMAAATAVIGHHDQDGIARFLRERFKLDSSS